MFLNDFVGKYKSIINSEIEAELGRRLAEVKDISPEIVKVVTVMRELSHGGKRMRGLLTILGYTLAQGNDPTGLHLEGVIKAAVIMELFHLGLLIQDDVMDRDSLRRGVATVHARYDDLHTGEAMAMCAGDLTFGWGMEILGSDQWVVISDQDRIKAMGVWGRYFSRVGYGQMLDVLQIADEESLLQILALKSGEYSCVLPLVFGATLGGAKSVLIKQLTEYGMELGWVFQLRDDYLAEWGDSTKTGKPVGNDRREGKHSFAILYGREKLEVEIKRHADLAKKATTDQTLCEIVDWMANRNN